jgi:preprotein translocase subunit SecA
MKWILKKILGTKNERDVKRLKPLIDRINELEEEYQQLSEEELQAKTPEFRKRLEEGETVEDILPEAFAAVKSGCRRLCGRTIDVCGHPIDWDMVPYDVQLIGGIVLHQGKIAEMATGEGKTLVATLPAYLNALTGEGVHIVTVNDYLALRDSEWMGSVYRYLGLTVGCIQNEMSPEERVEMYACDITYGTNSEFGFDYLRDNMAQHSDHQVQNGHSFSIVDEIDSILVDEARTPLIISGPAPYSTKQYSELKPVVDRLVRKQRDLVNKKMQEAKRVQEADDEEELAVLLYQVKQGMPKNKQLHHILEDAGPRRTLEKISDMMLTDMRKEEGRELREELYFTIDEKTREAALTEKGCQALDPGDPESYILPDLVMKLAELDGDEVMAAEDKVKLRQQMQDDFANRSEKIHAVDQLIRAYSLYERDVEYVVQENQVIIVDENTGRLMVGRRWSDGLHQAVEAKEGVKVERESQTLATITIQNYFRMYDKLSGMTGTAETEADEFHQIYKLDVVVIPTNRPVRRIDFNDAIFKTQREKYAAIMEEIQECFKRGQPVLVGTVSVEASELVSRMLRRLRIPHNVLNAKNHAREADIVIRAGQPGSVTIATNMAGRGTDIKLGEGVVTIAEEIVKSTTDLKDSYNGSTLGKHLEEDPCGLHVVGTTRHESRRIDRQLRGRCARQGDPGSSRFFISLEDDLMRLFGSDKMGRWMEKLGLEEGQVLEHPWLNRSVETAQKRVEQQYFHIRKRTLDYDDVMNKQREVIYGFRTEVLKTESPREQLYDILEDVVSERAGVAASASDEELVSEFVEWVNTTFPVGLQAKDLESAKDDAGRMTEVVLEAIKKAYELKISMEDPERLVFFERGIILERIDNHWQEYLRNMDALRQGVGLRAYGQRDPLVEYKKEAFQMFSELMDRIKEDISSHLFRFTSVEAAQNFIAALPGSREVHENVSAMDQRRQQVGEPPSADSKASAPAGAEEAMQAALNAKATPVRREAGKIGRNEPCPCGSGKKYKKCCGTG